MNSRNGKFSVLYMKIALANLNGLYVYTMWQVCGRFGLVDEKASKPISTLTINTRISGLLWEWMPKYLYGCNEN